MTLEPRQLTGPAPQAAPSGEKWLTFDLTAARLTLECVALGKSLFEIERDPGFPPAKTFIQWVMTYPDLARAYTVARELSGFMLEEEALFLAREVRRNPENTLALKAAEVLINHLKWAAGKRNPSVFSDKASVNVTVPIQINTTLDLGQAVSGATKDFPNIYEISAELDKVVPLEDIPLDVLERNLAEAEGRESSRPYEKPRAARSPKAADNEDRRGSEGQAKGRKNPRGKIAP